MFVCGVLQYHQSQQEQKGFRNQLEAIGAGVEKQKKELGSKLQDVASKMTTINALQQRYEALIDEVLTNININQDARLRIVAADKTNSLLLHSELNDLNAWETSLKANFRNKAAPFLIAHENTIKEERSYYVNARPCFDYAISTLTNLVWNVAKLKKDVVVLDCHDLPLTVDPDGYQTITVADVALRTNALWHFSVELAKRMQDGHWQLSMCSVSRMAFSDGKAPGETLMA